MTTWSPKLIEGWGRTHSARVPATMPSCQADAETALSERESVIAFGAGRSYADTALNSSGATLIMSKMNRIHAFDEATGEIVCEPGVQFQDLVREFLPRRFIAPVTPGTAQVTIGGAIANDVHGKNHDHVGSFGDHVNWIDLLLPGGEVRRVSPEADRRLFDATIGGIGLTGVILATSFNLVRVPSNAFEIKETRVADLEAFFAALSDARERFAYSVGWIDGMARGRGFGRGLLVAARHATEDVEVGKERRLQVPIDCPDWILNPWSVRLFNEVYYRRVPAGGRERRTHLAPFFYPLDVIRNWNRIYGRRGFYQFQCVLPHETSVEGISRLMEEISRVRRSSFLSVLKTLGRQGRGCLSFPMPGFTLAMDFPRKSGVEDFLARLEGITRDHGGRLYLAKDGCLSAEGFAAMYPRLDEFRCVLAEIDPDRKMDSDLARRLNIRGLSTVQAGQDVTADGHSSSRASGRTNRRAISRKRLRSA